MAKLADDVRRFRDEAPLRQQQRNEAADLLSQNREALGSRESDRARVLELLKDKLSGLSRTPSISQPGSSVPRDSASDYVIPDAGGDEPLLEIARDLRRLLEDRGWPGIPGLPGGWDADRYGPLLVPNLPPIELIEFLGNGDSARELVPQLFPPLGTTTVVTYHPDGQRSVEYVPGTFGTAGEVCFPIACPSAAIASGAPDDRPAPQSSEATLRAPNGATPISGSQMSSLYREPQTTASVGVSASGTPTKAARDSAPGSSAGNLAGAVRESVRDAVSERVAEEARRLGQAAGQAYRDSVRSGRPDSPADAVAGAVPGELMYRAAQTLGEKALLGPEERIIARRSPAGVQGDDPLSQAANGFIEKVSPLTYLLKQANEGVIEPAWSYFSNALEGWPGR